MQPWVPFGAANQEWTSLPSSGMLGGMSSFDRKRAFPIGCAVLLLVFSEAKGLGAGLVFQRDVRPIFSDFCYPCHGPDEKERKGKLRLDLREGMFKVSEGKAVVSPGKSGESELYKRVTSKDPEEVMPPPKFKRRLTERQIEVLRKWIDEGAQTGDHWAFVAPVRPELPKQKSKRWGSNPIDGFTLEKLEKEGLQPSPEADKTTLLRRVSLDLTGLPPTPAEWDGFLADKSADAYRNQVERLLKSPHYGERWARQWLDAARYADSDGFEKDKSRSVWFYRDWVIQAMNKDLPYNQFILEQIAGDLLPNAAQNQIVATGFLRNSMINEEGGVDPEQFRMDAVFDRMDAIGKSILGLTIQCAQCHTHKYDPLTQEEYYRMFGFLNNDHEAQRVVYTPEQTVKVSELRAGMQEVEAALRHRIAGWEESMDAWERRVRNDQPEWTTLNSTVEELSTGGQRYLPQKDGSFLALSYAPTKHTARLWVTNSLKEMRAFRLELLNDPNLPVNGPGRSFMGTCALTEFKVEAAEASNPTNKIWVKFERASADYANPERDLESNFFDKSDRQRVTGPVAMAIDGKEDTAWGIDAGAGRRNQPRKAVFVADKNVAFPGGTILTVHLMQNHGGWNSDDHMNNNLGRFRLSVSADTNVVADPVPAGVREILSIAKERRTRAQGDAVFSYWRTTVPEFRPENESLERLWAQWPGGSTALTLMPREESRVTSLLKRGDWLQPGKPVTSGVPAFLNPMPEGATADRLGFARWLANRSSPTTARVLVNRIWQAYFGVGIVSTPEDFGLQSEPPSHAELLDWLAVEFMEGGWKIKDLQRLIVLSSTYRQSSKMNEALLARDPLNRLLARGSRFRVDAEIVRDIALAVSGLLNAKVGGPSVFAPAPEYLFLPPASYAPFSWKEETGAERYRRALYTFRRRSTPYPALQAFDAPNGDFSCVKRMRSNTPLQALTGLNEPLFVEASQALARKALEEGGQTDAERIAYAFRRVLGRRPDREELKELTALLEKQQKRVGEGWVNANDVAGVKLDSTTKPQGTTTPTQLAAYTVVSRVLLNLDETITKE